MIKLVGKWWANFGQGHWAENLSSILFSSQKIAFWLEGDFVFTILRFG